MGTVMRDKIETTRDDVKGGLLGSFQNRVFYNEFQERK
jgi:hypothetical protein